MTKYRHKLYAMATEKTEFKWRKVMRVGGSVVVPLPRELRQKLGIGVGDYVKLKEGLDGTIIIEKEGRNWDGIIKRKD